MPPPPPVELSEPPVGKAFPAAGPKVANPVAPLGGEPPVLPPAVIEPSDAPPVTLDAVVASSELVELPELFE